MMRRGICVAVPIVCVSPIKSCAEGITNFNYDWGYDKLNVKGAKRTSFWLLRCTTASIFSGGYTFSPASIQRCVFRRGTSACDLVKVGGGG